MNELERELASFIAIPSVSADPAHAGDVRAACAWVCEQVRRAGGTAEAVETERHPLAVGFVPASVPDAPTVMIYGHFDVQPPGDPALWASPPFEPDVRDEWIYGRGASDDKGNLFLLLKAVETLARRGELTAGIRVVCDGEEEIGGLSVCAFVDQDAVPVQACILFDGPRPRADQPVFCTATRGLLYYNLRVDTGFADVHSGTYGGIAANALHALAVTLAAVAPADGVVAPELTKGAAEPTHEELKRWQALDPPELRLANDRIRPTTPAAAAELYTRTWTQPSIDVHGIRGGEATLVKTIIPARAEANISIRLAPGQVKTEIAQTFERLLKDALPAGATLQTTLLAASDPGQTDPSHPLVQAAAQAFAETTKTPPLFVREGGTLPILAALGKRGIPTVMTGFTLPDDNIHAPNERFRRNHLPLGIAAAAAMITAIGQTARVQTSPDDVGAGLAQ